MNRANRIFLASLLGLIPSISWAAEATQKTFEQQVDKIFGDYLVNPIVNVFFWNVPVINMPIVVAWLAVHTA